MPCSASSQMPGHTKQRRRTFTAVYMCNNSVVHWDGKGGLTLPVTMVIKINSVLPPYPLSKYVYARTNTYNVYIECNPVIVCMELISLLFLPCES